MNTYSLGIVIVRLMAEAEAKTGDFYEILPEHFWIALCKVTDLPDEVIAKQLRVPPERKPAMIAEVKSLQQWFRGKQFETTLMRRRLRSLLGKGKGSPNVIHRSAESLALFEAAAKIAEAEKRPMVTMIDLAQTIVKRPPLLLAGLLAVAGQRQEQQASSKMPDTQAGQTQQPAQRILTQFGRELTALAAQGALEPVIGRRDEIRRLAQALLQKRKGNALLVGEAGVGKTCLVEGLAQRIVSPSCPNALRGKRIFEISMTALLAGAGLRGDFEARLDAVIREAEAGTNILLFLDEIHTIISPSGGHDAANILKPALARGKVRMIGATTTPEYERYLLKDDAITRRFDLIWVDEPSRQETIEIISGVTSSLEAHHNVSIHPDAIESAVDLSIRYLPERRLPDKALDLLDQACAQCVLSSLSIKAGDADATVALQPQPPQIGREEIARVVSTRCNVPYQFAAMGVQERLQILEPFLQQRVIGQEIALHQISQAIQAAYRGLKDPRRPVASFLFAGPTGVGKTETAKALAEFLFGSAEHLIRIDLSEYMEKHQIARLLGAPPGYIGHESPGILTSALRKRSASVVLFDEIEKAHPDVLNVLLQILDEGQLTDGQGRKASFRETLVILTTNIQPSANLKKPLGFHAEPQPMPADSDEQQRLINALRTHLRPELLGRIRHILLFAPLRQKDYLAIAEQALAQIEERLQGEAGENLTIPRAIRQQIFARIDTFQFGARELEQLVEAEVAAWLLRSKTAEANIADTTSSAPAAGGVMMSIMRPAASKTVALLVLDLVKSTQFVLNVGDTYFNRTIGAIYKRFTHHPSAAEMLFLKCTGDGFLAVFNTVSAAMSVAATFLDTPIEEDVHVRMALHWGDVKTGPDGDVLGKEVHRVCRVEGVTAEHQSEARPEAEPLPPFDRILITREALEQLDSTARQQFRQMGIFHLKGFDEPCELFGYAD